MKEWHKGNVTLIQEDKGELTLYVSDDTVPLACQELALLPEELDRIVDVISQYKVINKS